MFRFFLVVFLIGSISGRTQDLVKIQQEVDSIWSIKVKSVRKHFKSEFDSVRYRVWYEKESKEVILVEETHYPVIGGLTRWWIYSYHFRDGNLVLMTKYNNTNLKDTRHQVAQYFFKNNSLLYLNESGTSIHDIETERKKAEYLKKKFSWY